MVSLLGGRTRLAVGVVGVAALGGLVVLAVGGPSPDPTTAAPTTGCTAPELTGTVVTVTVFDSVGPMMGAGPGLEGPSMMGGRAMAGPMQVDVDRAEVPAGVVSLLAVDAGGLRHEVVVLPLPADGYAGLRATDTDRAVDESGSLGEASSSCAEGGGSGIDPGTTGWVTTTLAAGRYELVCNLPGHYGAGMHTLLTVT